MADTKISALTAATVAAEANEIPINEAGTSKKITLALVREWIVKRAAAATVACGEFMTWLVLAANSGDITGTAQTVVMTITGVDVGRYTFQCNLIYQTTATTTGIDVSVNHTGTLTQFVVQHRYTAGGTTASSAAATMAAVGATGHVYEAQATRTKNGLIGGGTVSVDALNSDMLSIIEGSFVVSVSGDLQIKMAAETAALVCRAMQCSTLQLVKMS